MDRDVLTVLKILVIGESNVGKSSILLRFTDDEFHDVLKCTIGINMKSKIIEVDGNKIELSIWDTAGMERNRSITPSYYRGGQGVILVYDVTDRTTFNKLNKWLEDLDVSCKVDIVKMVVGNKIDLPNREVSKEEGKNFARRHKTLYVESSAKTADGIICCFEELVRKIIQIPDLWDPKQHSGPFNKASTEGTRNRLPKRGIQLTDDYEPENASSICSC